MPDGTVLVQDRGQRRVVAVHLGESGLAAVRLGPEPPPPLGEATERRIAHVVPFLSPPFFCGSSTGRMWSAVAMGTDHPGWLIIHLWLVVMLLSGVQTYRQLAKVPARP